MKKCISFENGLVILFLLLAAFGLLHHEMWLDEARTWLVAKHTAWDQLAIVAKSENHPVLWYSIVKFLNTLGFHPIAQQVLSLCLGALAYAVVIKHSPLSRLEKLLLAFNLYFLFEYTIISRNYSLEMLLLFSTCYLFTSKDSKAWALLLICGLLAQSHFYGFLWSIPFVVIFAFENKGSLHKLYADNKSRLALCFYIVCAIGSLWLVLRTGEQLQVIRDQKTISLHSVHLALNTLFLILFPAVNPETIISHTPTLQIAWVNKYGWIAFLASIGLITYSMRRSKSSLYISGFMFICSMIITFIRDSEGAPPRHGGQLILILLVARWLSSKKTQDKIFQYFFSAALLVQACSGLYMLYKDYHQPFSNGLAAAEWIKSSEYKDYEILAEGPFPASSYMVYLNNDFYSPIQDSKVYFQPLTANILKDTKVSFLKGGKPIVHTQLIKLKEKMTEAICTNNEKIILVSSYKNDFMKFNDIKLLLLSANENSIRENENFYIYKVTSDRSRLCSDESAEAS